MIAVGMNYPKHTEEIAPIVGHKLMGGDVAMAAKEPVLFLKGDAPVRQGFPFFIPDFSKRIDYEAEIIVKINRTGKYIAERFAHRYYSEVSIGVDFTARDLQKDAVAKGLPWSNAKAFDGCAALGNFISVESLGDRGVQDIDFSLCIDGHTVQQGNTSQMLHTIDHIIAYASMFYTLKIGDIIFTGTPAGVGPVQIGQRLEGFIRDQKLLEIDIK